MNGALMRTVCPRFDESVRVWFSWSLGAHDDAGRLHRFSGGRGGGRKFAGDGPTDLHELAEQRIGGGKMVKDARGRGAHIHGKLAGNAIGQQDLWLRAGLGSNERAFIKNIAEGLVIVIEESDAGGGEVGDG